MFLCMPILKHSPFLAPLPIVIQQQYHKQQGKRSVQTTVCWMKYGEGIVNIICISGLVEVACKILLAVISRSAITLAIPHLSLPRLI